MCRRISFSLICALFLGLGACGSDSPATVDAGVDAPPPDAAAPDAAPPLFTPQPECEGASVVPLMGDHAVVVSALAIGELEDGFDLDRDGEPDNALSTVSDLAGEPIADALESFELVVPFELFDYPTAAADECVKLALYFGSFTDDTDADGAETAVAGGDCNDHDAAIAPGIAEVADNLKDDDCDGLADETEQDDGQGGTVVVPSTNADDNDADGVTIADGDCDDDNPAVLGPTGTEVCSDGYDNDCSGVADHAVREDDSLVCTPLDDVPEEINIDPQSVDQNGDPLVAFKSAEVTDVGGALVLRAGPSLFTVRVPIFDDLVLDLRLTGATLEATVVDGPNGLALSGGRVGGVIDARTADGVRGIAVEQIGLEADDSFLDAVFANALGAFLPALGTLPISETGEWPDGCKTPDIDVDRDGLEGFCDTDGDKEVDLCVDGDLSLVFDEKDATGEVTKECTDATDDEGNYRFVDGVSVELNFEAMPTVLPASIGG